MNRREVANCLRRAAYGKRLSILLFIGALAMIFVVLPMSSDKYFVAILSTVLLGVAISGYADAIESQNRVRYQAQNK